jgi:hypothetical protein
MSTIKADTLSNLAGTQTVPVSTVAQGSAKAWVNFDGTTTVPTIRANFNVSSVTRNGTGDYNVNFTTAMPDANYSVSLQGTGENDTTNQTRILQIKGTSAAGASNKTTTALQIVRGITGTAGSYVDGAEINVVIFR